MTFGEKLKSLRQEREWSQPELADRIGIEQSYLSKLETGKALPSNDVLQRILQVFQLDPSNMLGDLERRQLKKELGALPLVASFLSQQKSDLIELQKRWLAGWTTCCVLGFTLLIAGLFALLFSNQTFEYESSELVPKGAQGEVFSSLDEYIHYAIGPELLAAYTPEMSQVEFSRLESNAYQRLILRLQNLRSADYVASRQDRGVRFTRDRSSSVAAWDAITAAGIDSGVTRTYQMVNTGVAFRLENRILTLLGVFLLLCGVFSFLAERRLSRFSLTAQF